jgi:three-Cys-motif partner protein
LAEQLNIFHGYDEAPQGWSSPVKPPPTDLSAPQLPLLTGSGLIPEGESGALARAITPHSLRKQDRIVRYVKTVSTAMAKRWDIWWLDLFAGPGAVYERHDSIFRPGIPMQVADQLRNPLDGYVFNDLSEDCVNSLRRRFSDRSNITIGQGDANNRAHLEALIAQIPREALVIAYLDPQGLDLHLATIRFLAWRFRYIDILVNLPVQAIDRAISANAVRPVRNVIEHPEPTQLIEGGRTASNIREWFLGKLAGMGYSRNLSVGETIRSENGVPQYDLLLASRSPTAGKLYRRANQGNSDGQRGFELAV